MSPPKDLAHGAQPIIGRSSVIRRLEDMLARIAASDLDVLLTGEVGVGKEFMARQIHRRRVMAGHHGPFVLVGGKLVESTVERDSTLFVQEVADLSPTTQSDLLHILCLRNDVRVTAATSRRPIELRSHDVIRRDLYYRLCEYIIEIPPLRERREDIRPLADHFLAELGTSQHLSEAAHRAIGAFKWPGNVRELKFTIRRAALFHPDTQELGPEHVFEHMSQETRNVDLSHVLDYDWDRGKDELARWYWTEVFRKFNGDLRKVAEHTGVSEVWLRNRRRAYGLHLGSARRHSRLDTPPDRFSAP